MTKPEIMSFQTIRPKFWSKMFLSLRLVFIIVISGLTEIVVAANGSLRNGGVNSIPKDGPYKSAQSAASVSLVNGHYASVEEDYEAPDLVDSSDDEAYIIICNASITECTTS